MSFCQHCGGELREIAARCEKCGRIAEVAASESVAPPKEITLKGAVVLALVVITFLFFGNFHILHGHGIGLSFAQRKSFGFNEMFVNIDEITGMPAFAAMMKYPLGTQVLQREGYIESPQDEMARSIKELEEIGAKITEEVKQSRARLAQESANEMTNALQGMAAIIEQSEKPASQAAASRLTTDELRRQEEIGRIRNAVFNHRIGSQVTTAKELQSIPSTWNGVALDSVSATEIENNQVWWYERDSTGATEVTVSIHFRNSLASMVNGIGFELDKTNCPNIPGDGKILMLQMKPPLASHEDVVLTAKVDLPRAHPAFQSATVCGTVVAVW